MTAGSATLVLLLLVSATCAGAAFLARLLPGREEHDAAVALGLPAGLLVAALPGWVVSAFARVSFGWVSLLAAIALGALLAFSWRQAVDLLRSGRNILFPALLPLAVALLFLWVRWPQGAIRDTEKPMDLAVLSAVTATPSLPLEDPWLAGERFSYYYFGTYVLGLPFRLAGVAPELAFNLIAALLPALAAAAAFAAVRLRGGGRALATGAALFLVGAGTFDGARQLLGSWSLGEIDLWASSRRVAGAITEWPLFTFRLGDLHAHALALPFLLAWAGTAGRLPGTAGLIAEAALMGSVVAMNPWDLPAALVLLAAGVLLAPRLLRGLGHAALSGLLAIPVVLPFLLGPRPPVEGLVRAPTFTTSPEAFLHLAGFVVVPALALGVALVRSQELPDTAFLAACLAPALGVVLSILTGAPVLGLGIAFLCGAAMLVPRLSGALRAGFLLAAAATILLSFPEVLVVKDAYDETYRRMNTVFKLWAGAVPLLVVASALLLPLALATRRARVLVRVILAGALAAALAHPAAVVSSRWEAHGGTLDGLSFLEAEAPGDRAAIRWLRSHAPPGAVVAEAPGAGYTMHSRISSGSGRPTILGWSTHEQIWRGTAVVPEIEARRADLRAIYTSRDPDAVRAALSRRRVRYVVVGPLERKDFGGEDVFPFRRACRAILDSGGTSVWEVPSS